MKKVLIEAGYVDLVFEAGAWYDDLLICTEEEQVNLHVGLHT